MLTCMVRILFALAAWLALADPIAAQSIVSQGGSYARISLLPGRMGPDDARLAGLKLTLAPGWKSYWRSPGAAGIPPAFDWSGSTNLASAEVLWPRPVLFESFGLETVGYRDDVILPIRLVAKDPSRPIHLALAARVALCSDICLIEEARIDRMLRPGLSAETAAVARAVQRVPRPARSLGLRAITCRIAGAGPRRRFSATLDFTEPPREPEVLLEGPGETWFENVRSRRTAGRIHVSADLLAPGQAWVARAAIRMTILGIDGFAADQRGCG